MKALDRVQDHYRPLAGIRVIDLSVGIAGPMTSRYLAGFGADVIRVESRRYPDSVRLSRASWLPSDAPQGVKEDSSVLLQTTNAGKRSICVETDQVEGRAILERLIVSADAFVTNLMPATLDTLRIQYPTLMQINPRLIYVALSGFGDEDAGEYRAYRTWGTNLAAFCGLYSLTGEPSGHPVHWSLNYTDFIAAQHAVVAVLAAIKARRQSGLGYHIDLALYEAVAAGLSELIERALSGDEGQNRRGNTDPRFLCQGVFRLAHADRWFALTIRDESDLTRLSVQLPALLGIAPNDLPARLRELLQELDEGQIVAAVRMAGVPGALVADVRDLRDDIGLRDRGLWQVRPHARFGQDLVQALPIMIDGARISDLAAAPSLGQDTESILQELGFTREEIDRLVHEGAVSTASPPETAPPRPYLRLSPLPLGLGNE